MLLALTSLFRVSEIAFIDFKSIVFSGLVVKFELGRLRKSQRKGSLEVFSLNRLNSSPLICPVSCLERLRSPHPHIGASTIGRWINLLLSEAGVDATIYSAHSTRDLSIESILWTGSWASESVFSRHYNRLINKEAFGTFILDGEAIRDEL
ncbi:hypothetical protein GHT06_022583 [Daphnia sinensis]|uniref:Tyr recombinase domain-containing protein n=1 Tax=Daphnia sinensis TaxID=1820382 RepID=A0AAD5L707_9CRUS|nr:hypothetical protein GHT06_022583 [Daphnia sinensis]